MKEPASDEEVRGCVISTMFEPDTLHKADGDEGIEEVEKG